MTEVIPVPSPSQIGRARTRLSEIATAVSELRQREARALAERRSMATPRDAYDLTMFSNVDRALLSMATQIAKLEAEGRELSAVVEDADRRAADQRAREAAEQQNRDRDRAVELAERRVESASMIDIAFANLAKAFRDYEVVGFELGALEGVTKISHDQFRQKHSILAALAHHDESLGRLLGYERFAHGDPTSLTNNQRDLLARIIPVAVAAE